MLVYVFESNELLAVQKAFPQNDDSCSPEGTAWFPSITHIGTNVASEKKTTNACLRTLLVSGF